MSVSERLADQTAIAGAVAYRATRMHASGNRSPISEKDSQPIPTTKKSNTFHPSPKKPSGPAATHTMDNSMVNRTVNTFSKTLIFEFRGESGGSVGSANASRTEKAAIIVIEIFPKALESAIRLAFFCSSVFSRDFNFSVSALTRAAASSRSSLACAASSPARIILTAPHSRVSAASRVYQAQAKALEPGHICDICLQSHPPSVEHG